MIYMKLAPAALALAMIGGCATTDPADDTAEATKIDERQKLVDRAEIDRSARQRQQEQISRTEAALERKSESSAKPL